MNYDIYGLIIAERGEKFDGTFNAWDSGYYERILLENEYAVDQEEIKKYFSLETAIQSTKQIMLCDKNFIVLINSFRNVGYL